MEHPGEYEETRRPCGPQTGDDHCHHAQPRGPEDHRYPHGEPGRIPTERNRYFMGKYMAARDFWAEQEYFLGRHQLHNRMMHGWGIVCGLEVRPHPDPKCRDRWVVIRPGMAIDCYGRELVLDREWAVELPFEEHHGLEHEEEEAAERFERGKLGGHHEEHGEHHEEHGGHHEEHGEHHEEHGEHHEEHGEHHEEHGGHHEEHGGHHEHEDEYLLCLEYHERETQPVPALYAEDPCNPAQMEANRISEGVCWVLRERDDLPPLCWRKPRGEPGDIRVCEAEEEYEEGEGEAKAGPSCLDQHCDCGALVPLALIHRQRPHGFEIDLRGRRFVPSAGAQLTHIVKTNWPHGGALNLSRLARAENQGGLGGRLKIYFDRPVQPAPPADKSNATGVNPYTFIVQNHLPRDEGYSVYTLFNDGDVPYLEEGGCVAVFPLPPELLSGDWNLGRSTLVIQLKCDFVLDRNGLPVDGNFLGGRMPTGNGSPGGVFESWFYVIPDVQPSKRRRPGPMVEEY